MPSIEDIYRRAKEGEITLTPYAVINLYAAKERVAPVDNARLEETAKNVLNSDSIYMTLSTKNVANLSDFDQSAGFISNITMTLEPGVGGSFSATLDDVNAGRQLRQFINETQQENGRVVTTFASVKYGWLSSEEDEIESVETVYMLQGIRSSYKGGRFNYTIHGMSFPAVRLAATATMEGNYTGTVYDALLEWQKNTGIKIVNIETIDRTTTIGAANGIIPTAGMTPLHLLNQILRYAEFVDPKVNAQSVAYRLLPDVRDADQIMQRVVLTAVTNRISGVYKTYPIGHPNSTVLEADFDDDLIATGLSDEAVVRTLNIDKAEYSLSGTNETTVQSDQRVDNHASSETDDYKADAVNALSLSDYDVREGVLTVVGDPHLIPNRNMTVGSGASEDFYTAKRPFLGIKIDTFVNSPVNFDYVYDTKAVKDAWFDDIYFVEEIVHDLTESSYTTSMKIKTHIGLRTLVSK